MSYPVVGFFFGLFCGCTHQTQNANDGGGGVVPGGGVAEFGDGSATLTVVATMMDGLSVPRDLKFDPAHSFAAALGRRRSAQRHRALHQPGRGQPDGRGARRRLRAALHGQGQLDRVRRGQRVRQLPGVARRLERPAAVARQLHGTDVVARRSSTSSPRCIRTTRATARKAATSTCSTRARCAWGLRGTTTTSTGRSTASTRIWCATTSRWTTARAAATTATASCAATPTRPWRACPRCRATWRSTTRPECSTSPTEATAA